MKTIKTKQENVERSRPTFIQIGLILALVAVLAAFEWKTYDKNPPVLTGTAILGIIEDLPPMTVQLKPPPPPINVTELRIIKELTADIPEMIIEAGVNMDVPEPIYIPPALPDEPVEPDDTPHFFVELMPEFPGGEAALRSFLSKHLRYPELARSIGISGTVYLSFVVERDGSITEIEVLRGIEGGLSEEAVRVVRMMPAWKPGIQSGRYVRVKFTMPIRFVLQL